MPPSRPCATEGREQADPRDGRRQDERKLDQRDHDRAAAKASRGEQVGGRRTEEQDDRLRDRRRLGRDDQRVERDVAAELAEELAGRDPQEDREDRDQQERQDENEREQHPHAEETARTSRASVVREGDPPNVLRCA